MKVLVIGAGNMGLTYATAIARSGILKKEDLMIYDKSTEVIDRLSNDWENYRAYNNLEDTLTAGAFMQQVDSGAVYHNASTRFTDGGQMGVGAELAISTDKLHHRGPLGLEQLVTNKYYVYGNGHVRV